MSKNLHPTIETFYNSTLNYAGLQYDPDLNYVLNINSKMGDFTIHDKKVTLPYIQNLKHPNNRSMFHLLNENYLSPESPLFLLYKKRLVCEINLKLSQLVVSLIHVANSVELQNKIGDSEIIDIISDIKKSDMSLIENFLNVISKSKAKNDEAFIIDIHLKKNGEINKTPYAAIGKVLFNIQNELKSTLEDDAKESRLFGVKLRKKDLLALDSIFSSLFGDSEQLKEFTEGSDNKVFRYLNVLLSTSYLVTSVINRIGSKLKDIDDGSLRIDDIMSDHQWTKLLPEIYDLTTEIRKIPNQDEFVKEEDNVAKHRNAPVQRLNVDESRVMAEAPLQQQQQSTLPPLQPMPQPVYQPTPQQAYQPAYMQQQAPVPPMQQPPQMTPEEIIRMKANRAMSGQQMTPMYQQPMYPPMQQQQYIPAWMQQQQQPPQQQMYQQQIPQQYVMMGNMQGMQQPMYAPQMQGNMGYPQQMQQPMYPASMQQAPMRPSY